MRLLAGATILAIGGLLIPYVKGGWIVAVVVIGLGLVLYATRRVDTRLSAFILNGPPTLRFALFNIAVITVCLGFTELIVAALAEQGMVKPFRAMETIMPAGTEDWRTAHITADEFREPDPILWWRPVHRAPYNAQGFKGPTVDPARHTAVRIMTYGDSNTDGPDRGAWPERLHNILQNRTNASFEVLNAGVTGYSSHQGVRRFEQDAPVYRPNIVTVSFGWNDPASTATAPDSAFEAPSQFRARVQRALLRYKSYLMLLNWLKNDDPAAGETRSRVSLDEYRRNLERFRQIADATGTRVVVMTRPHRETPDALRATAPAWRALVPQYNDALRQYAEHNPTVLLVDVQKLFEPHVNEFVDECHFSPDGHARMADSVRDALDQAGLLR